MTRQKLTARQIKKTKRINQRKSLLKESTIKSYIRPKGLDVADKEKSEEEIAEETSNEEAHPQGEENMQAEVSTETAEAEEHSEETEGEQTEESGEANEAEESSE